VRFENAPLLMRSKFEVAKRLKGDRHVIRLKQRAEALRYIETTGKCPGAIPWPLTDEILGQGPDAKLCSLCDLYMDCPILDRLQTKGSPNFKKTPGT